MADDIALKTLRDMFWHHAWATLQLIDYCSSLTPEQLSGSTPGTRGPILETLEHLVGVDQRYKRRFGVNSEPAVKEGGGITLELMRAVVAKEAELWQSLLGRLSEFDITIEAEPRENPPWPEAPHATNLLLIQAIHHGNDHRTQICTILGAEGLAAPDLSCWAYWASERIAKEG